MLTKGIGGEKPDTKQTPTQTPTSWQSVAAKAVKQARNEEAVVEEAVVEVAAVEEAAVEQAVVEEVAVEEASKPMDRRRGFKLANALWGPGFKQQGSSSKRGTGFLGVFFASGGRVAMPTNVKPIAVEGDGEHVFVLLLNDKTFAFSSTCRRLADIVASVLATPNMKLLLCPPPLAERSNPLPGPTNG